MKNRRTGTGKAVGKAIRRLTWMFWVKECVIGLRTIKVEIKARGETQDMTIIANIYRKFNLC